MRYLPLLPLVTSLAACGGAGSASVTGTFGTFGLELNTVFGWIDATESKMEDGKLVFVPRDNTRLHVVMSGAVFDPNRDLRFATATELLDLGREGERKGSVSIDVRNYHVFTAGGQLAVPNMGANDAPRLELDVAPGLTELSGDATYPAVAPRFGKNLTATLTVSEAGRAAGESAVGTLNIKIAAGDGDPADVTTGEVTIEFDAPLVSERIAECNNSSRLTDDDCEPGYPAVHGQ